MEEKKMTESATVREILALYALDTSFDEQKEYIHYVGEDNLVKIILSVRLGSGERVVIKILRESEDILREREKIEQQSTFSEFLRRHGIPTPKRYAAGGRYCNAYTYRDLHCNVTAEDWCGEELRYIDEEIAYRLGALLARMHELSLQNGCRIGCGTLFSAAYWNDVDAYDSFCKLTQDERLDRAIVEHIKALRDEKLAALRAVWDTLPKAAVQGDISINNLVCADEALRIFDYNNAGDEVLVSDLVMEGLLTAYEMDLPEGADESCREQIFPALLRGYLSVRHLREEEAAAAWTIYTLYHALWFTRVIYNENSLEKMLGRGAYDDANRLLAQMLADMHESDDGRFRA